MFETLKNGWQRVKDAVSATIQTAKAYCQTLLGGGVVGGAAVATAGASAQVTLPDTGLDLTDYIPLMVTGLGTVVGAVVAAWIAFRLIDIGLKKLKKVGG